MLDFVLIWLTGIAILGIIAYAGPITMLLISLWKRIFRVKE